MRNPKFDLIKYIAGCKPDEGEECRVKPLTSISQENGISIAMLREQLGVARAYGFVDVKPRSGIHRLEYQFAPAVSASLSYAVKLDRKYFNDFSDLRRKIETSYWFEAVEALTDADMLLLQKLVTRAWKKLESDPPQLPHAEHRELHSTLFGRLDNIFVIGVLQAYWDAYEEIGYSQYTELAYLKTVWEYHRKIVDALYDRNYDEGYRLLLEHMNLFGNLSGIY